MKKIFFFLAILFALPFAAQAQNRNAAVKVLNNYITYNNSNITALTALEKTLERYNDLFDSYLRKNRQLGGEEYEKPKPSPFVDADVFYMNQDNPDYLYNVAIKESVSLPANIRTELNNSIKAIRACSQKLVKLTDSLSNIFSGPMIDVKKNESTLPYNLLAEARRQLDLSGKYRDQLFASLTAYYNKSYAISTNDYMRSVEKLGKGMSFCQRMMDDLGRNDSSKIALYVNSLDSLRAYLDQDELNLLKGIKPFGNSKHFPNRAYFNGFDLYAKYERIVDGLRIFSDYGKDFINQKEPASHMRAGKCYFYHKQCSERFNSYGVLHDYNEYVLLIGGGKMKVESDVGTLMKGWGDEKTSLPTRTILFWMKETPRFEIEWPAN